MLRAQGMRGCQYNVESLHASPEKWKDLFEIFVEYYKPFGKAYWTGWAVGVPIVD